MRISLLFLMCFWALEICPFCAQAGAKGIMINGIEFNAKSIQKPAAHMDGFGSPFSPASLDTLFSFPAPGNFPAGLAWDGQYIWHSDYNLDTVYKMTTAGSIVSSFPFSQSGGDMTWDGNNLWMVDEQMALLYKIDPTTGTVIDQFDLPSSGQIDPNGWGIAWDGQYLWHSEYATTAMIYKLDPQNAQVIDSFPPPENFILGIEWVGSFLYGVSTTGHTLYKFDPATGAVLDTETWPAGFALGLTWDGQYFWNVDNSNKRIYQISSTLTSINDEVSNRLNDFVLQQNYPNPFNPTTTVRYRLGEDANVVVFVFSADGRLVKTLVDRFQTEGEHSVTWDAHNASSGVYFFQLEADGFSAAKKGILLK